eukprot:c19684_g1_i1 orf=355-834(-)
MDFCHGRCASEVGIEAFMQHPAVTNSASSFLVGKNFLQNFCEPKSANKQTLQINLQQARHFGRPRCSFHGRIWSPSLHQGLSGDVNNGDPSLMILVPWMIRKPKADVSLLLMPKNNKHFSAPFRSPMRLLACTCRYIPLNCLSMTHLIIWSHMETALES